MRWTPVPPAAPTMSSSRKSAASPRRSSNSELRVRSGTIATNCDVRLDGVVPVAMEVVAMDVEGTHLGVGALNAGRIGVVMDLAPDLQSSVGCRCSDQLNDGLVADQRAAAPVLCDEREEPMLDLVPFAGTGRQMTDRDVDAEFVGESLQLALPEPDPHAIAAAAISSDQEPRRLRIVPPSHRLPPQANGIHGETRSIVVDADAHPASIAGDVVDAVGRCPAKLRDDEVVHAHRLRLPHRTVFTTTILEIADQLLLLAVDADPRLAPRHPLL